MVDSCVGEAVLSVIVELISTKVEEVDSNSATVAVIRVDSNPSVVVLNPVDYVVVRTSSPVVE